MSETKNHWDIPGVPHKGWQFDYMIDMGEPLHICEMCGQEGVRYVHVMKHPEYQGMVKVGCICAEKMENDYVNPKRRERDMRNKHNRMLSFMKKKWSKTICHPLAVLRLKYKGKWITIARSKYNENEYGVWMLHNHYWEYSGEKIRSIDEAKRIAFEVFDAWYLINREEN